MDGYPVNVNPDPESSPILAPRRRGVALVETMTILRLWLRYVALLRDPDLAPGLRAYAAEVAAEIVDELAVRTAKAVTA
jgi:hypothetical protein